MSDRMVSVECVKPIKFYKDDADSFIRELNNRRRRMVDGDQKNGLYSVPQNLPKGQNVLEMNVQLSNIIIVTFDSDVSSAADVNVWLDQNLRRSDPH
ncbi:hypothetical protein Y032_0242g3443 [Ancylostoma ceylanicum]|uniref:Uncharacterized protein n=1 Tax=Ancylostoma ceylanicum TaxID=53326 RepID=A0A016SEN3_9BILA|nr:hypothetical protein Y032_0242g3443 [Ancylostoma ceylanicum]